ncbi:putative vacuolar protein sorting-associated protein TDA6 [Colletotrichum viniferum]|nr:putative vacuolar protein sorting-associated protein TDA6 [Colletotrichum viniferum]
MAGTSSTHVRASISGLLVCFFGILLAYSARAGPEPGPDAGCPEYVARHGISARKVLAYPPLLWLHSDDPFKPSDLLTHVRHTTPAVDRKPISDLPSLDLDNLEILNAYGNKDHVALVSDDDPTTYPKWLYGEAPDETGRIHNSTPCVVVLVEKNERELDAFYFYFYSFNEGPNITQVLEPLDRLVKGPKAASGMHFGDHIGDWEHNMVRFKDGKPTGIYFSQHVDGAALQVHNAALVDYCDEGEKWDPVLSAYFYRFHADSFTVTRVEPPEQSFPKLASDANLTSLFYYTGRWGDLQWLDSDPRQQTVPRFGLKRFESGPTGPRHKHLVRKGLKPDHRRKMGWTEWAVGIYMAWYPCCLKGWRKWVLFGGFVVMLSAIVVGIVIGVRRYRRRKYQRLQAEDIPLDDWVLEEDSLLSSSDEDDEIGKAGKNKLK